jgi:hypothetical protein
MLTLQGQRLLCAIHLLHGQSPIRHRAPASNSTIHPRFHRLRSSGSQPRSLVFLEIHHDLGAVQLDSEQYRLLPQCRYQRFGSGEPRRKFGYALQVSSLLI